MSFPMVALDKVVRDLTNERLVQVDPNEDVADPTIASRTHTISIAAVQKGISVKISKRVRIEPNDLVFSRLHTQNGAFAFADRSYLATNTFLPLAIDETQIDRRFLFWALHVRVPTLAASDTVGRETYKTQDILGLKIPFPVLSAQRRIVARIVELAAKIEEARGLRKKAGEEVEALLMAALIQMRKDLQNNNSTKKIGQISQVTAGGTPLRDVSIYWGGSIPWVKTGELMDGDIYKTEEYISQEGLENSSAKLFPLDTVLIALYGQGQTRGRTGRLMIEAATNQACCAILPAPSIFESRFIQYWLRSLYTEMREKSRDGAQPNWNGQMIKNIEIAIPPLPEQRRIVAYLDELQAKVDALRRLQAETGAELDALLPAVLDRAFKGDL